MKHGFTIGKTTFFALGLVFTLSGIMILGCFDPVTGLVVSAGGCWFLAMVGRAG